MKIKVISTLLLITVFSLMLNADAISSFAADNTNVKPGDNVNLTLDYTATKKYQLNFNAYKQPDNTELPAIFSATDLKHVRYFVPSDADYDIKIIAKLSEDGSSIDSKEVTISTLSIDTVIDDINVNYGTGERSKLIYDGPVNGPVTVSFTAYDLEYTYGYNKFYLRDDCGNSVPVASSIWDGNGNWVTHTYSGIYLNNFCNLYFVLDSSGDGIDVSMVSVTSE